MTQAKKSPTMLERATETMESTYSFLNNHNLQLAREGTRDQDTIQAANNCLSYLELLNRKTRGQKLTGRSGEYVPFSDDDADMDD